MSIILLAVCACHNMDDEFVKEIDDEFIEEIDDEIQRRSVNIQKILIVGFGAISNYKNFLLKQPCRDSSHTGAKFMFEIQNGNDTRCHEMFRMEKHVFSKLCDKLKELGLCGSRGISLEEVAGMFLMTLGHCVGNRMIQEQFQHSGETVSRHFTNVLKYVSLLSSHVIKPIENYDEVPYHIQQNPKYMPYFKDCIGAIDGTHVRVTLSEEEQGTFIGRKGYPTTNIMAACGFDMQFTFVWPGWEGSAHDTHIFFEALRSPELNFQRPPGDKYYLVDAGYPNMKGFLAPYKGERYHLPEFRRGNQPRGPKEIFNKAHSSLRSAIERTFGVWKARWNILHCMPNYNYDKQIAIIGAAMALHNFIRKEAIIDVEFQLFENRDYLPGDEDADISEHITMDDSEMGIIHDKITLELMRG